MNAQTDTPAVIAQTGASAILISYYNDALVLVIPFAIVALSLVVTDLFFGIGAAKMRNEDIRLSKALRRTLDKLLSYVCWIIVAASLSISFAYRPLNWIILGVVCAIELISIFSNYMACKGKKVTGLDGLLIKIISDKLNTDMSGVKVEDNDTKGSN